jgi:O-antigen/teichoic acid export membrane protein
VKWALPVTVADQAVSNASNVLLPVLVSRSGSTRDLGIFALVFSSYSLVLGLSRVIGGELLLSVVTPEEQQHAKTSGFAFVCWLSAWTGLALLLVAPGAGIVLGRSAAISLCIVGASMPFLLAQDYSRYFAFREQRPHAALFLDSAWLVAFIVLAYLFRDLANPTSLLACWGLAAAFSSLLAMVLFGRRLIGSALLKSTRSRARTWRQANWMVGWRFAADYVVTMGSYQLMILLVAAVGGVTVAGVLRGAQVLLGPIGVIFAGVGVFVIPRIAGQGRTAREAIRPALLTSALMLPVAVVWIAFLLWLPNTIGIQLLGPSWFSVRDSLPAIAPSMIGAALYTGPLYALRALRSARVLLRTVVVACIPAVVLPGVGAWLDGARGFGVGYSGSAFISAAGLWLALLVSVPADATAANCHSASTPRPGAP